MTVTIKDIAKILNISSATVSRALNGKPGVSEPLREKIIDLADEHGYHPNAIAQGLVRKTTNTVGLIIPDITNPYYPMIARGLEEAAREMNYQLFLSNSNWDKDREEQLIRTMISNRVGGIIIDPATTDLSHIIDSGIPTVYLSNDPENIDTTYIGIDNYLCGSLGVRHLFEKGYRRIAYLGGSDSYSNEERIHGYRDGLKACGLPCDERLIRSKEFSTEWGYKGTGLLSALDGAPDAYLGGNDLIAYGIMNFMAEKGKTVPEEIGILGIDNIPSSSLPQISLSSIGITKQDIGNKAFTLLHQLMTSEVQFCEKKLIEPKLFERRTTRRGFLRTNAEGPDPGIPQVEDPLL